jgi:hypothetical protein
MECPYISAATETYSPLYFLVLKFYGTASVVWWSEFLTTDAGVPGSIPGHYKKKISGSGTGRTQPCEYN